MKCPYCDKQLEMMPYVEHNVNAYNEKVIATTLCCGHGVLVKPIRTFSVEKYQGGNTKDSWNVSFKKEVIKP